MAMQIGGGGNAMADINITPLVDVMLVLLVIFMVTAPMLSSSKTNVKLPPVETGETLSLDDKKDTIFVVGTDRQIRFYNCKSCASMDLSNIVGVLRHNQKVKNAKRVYLYGDQTLKYGYILQVMARLHQAGIANVGLVTDPAGLKLDKGKKAP
jgi:biopolymer transport protein TolR